MAMSILTDPSFTEGILQQTQLMPTAHRAALEQLALKNKQVKDILLTQVGVSDEFFDKILTKAAGKKVNETSMIALSQIAHTPARRKRIWELAGPKAIENLITTWKLTEDEAAALFSNEKVSDKMIGKALRLHQFPPSLEQAITEKVGGLRKILYIFHHQAADDDATLEARLATISDWIGSPLKEKAETLKALLFLRPHILPTLFATGNQIAYTAIAGSPFIAGNYDMPAIMARVQDASGNDRLFDADEMMQIRFLLKSLIHNPALSHKVRDRIITSLTMIEVSAMNGTLPLQGSGGFELGELIRSTQTVRERDLPELTTPLSQVTDSKLFRGLLYRALPNSFSASGRPFDLYQLASNPLMLKEVKRFTIDTLNALTNDYVLNEYEDMPGYDPAPLLETLLDYASLKGYINPVEQGDYKAMFSSHGAAKAAQGTGYDSIELLDTDLAISMLQMDRTLFIERASDSLTPGDGEQAFKAAHPDLEATAENAHAADNLCQQYQTRYYLWVTASYISKHLPATPAAWEMFLSLAGNWSSNLIELVDTTSSLL